MFDGYIRDHAKWRPRSAAVITPSRTVSYAEFDADIDRVAATLGASGVLPPGGVVSIALPEAYPQLTALAALARLGVATSHAYDEAADLRLTPEGLAALPPAGPTPPLQPPRDPAATGRVLLSSGTTGPAHRVALSWRRIEASVHAAVRVYGAGRLGTWIPLTGLGTLLGNIITFTAWQVGAAVGAGFPRRDLPQALESLPPGLIGLTPLYLSQLLAGLPDGFQPRPAWRLISSGATLPIPLGREVCRRLTPDLIVNYGATEHTFMATGPFQGLEQTHGCVGHTPAGAELQVVGPDGWPLPPGETGEIRVRGPRASDAYLDDPAATAQRFRDGWFHPGDLGRLLPDGGLVIEGRVDDRMNLGGLKFMPQALEGPALDCPGVLDAAAFAVPGPEGMDECWLAVSAAPGFDRDHLGRHLAGYPNLPPNRFAWIDEIPRNAMGKVERTKLRDAVLAVTREG